MCGAVSSILLLVAFFVYLGIKLRAVVQFEDAQINSYEIKESRSNQEEALRIGDYSAEFVFGFFIKSEGLLVSLEPRIGRYELTQRSRIVHESGYYDSNTPV